MHIAPKPPRDLTQPASDRRAPGNKKLAGSSPFGELPASNQTHFPKPSAAHIWRSGLGGQPRRFCVNPAGWVWGLVWCAVGQLEVATGVVVGHNLQSVVAGGAAVFEEVVGAFGVGAGNFVPATVLPLLEDQVKFSV